MKSNSSNISQVPALSFTQADLDKHPCGSSNARALIGEGEIAGLPISAPIITQDDAASEKWMPTLRWVQRKCDGGVSFTLQQEIGEIGVWLDVPFIQG